MNIQYLTGIQRPNYIEQSNYRDGIAIYHWELLSGPTKFTVAVFKIHWKDDKYLRLKFHSL